MNCSHECLICLGSNKDGVLRLKAAESLLDKLFPGIQWGRILTTIPEGTDFPALYSNRAARLHTTLTPEELQLCLKEVECRNGRRPEDKQRGIVVLDIDLLTYDVAYCAPRTGTDIMYSRLWKHYNSFTYPRRVYLTPRLS